MEMTKFVRKPFEVDAIQITEENINELAEFIGTIRKKNDEDGSVYIQVDRRLIPNIDRVFPGYWFTRMGNNARCYSEKIFSTTFVPVDENIQQWVDFMNTVGEPTQEVGLND